MKRGDKIRATRFDGTVFEGIATQVLSNETNVEFFNGDVDLFAGPGGEDYWGDGWTFEVLKSPIAVGDVIDAERVKELPVGSLVRGAFNGLNGLVASDGLVSVDIGGDGHVVLAFEHLTNGYIVLHIAEPPEV